MPSRRRPSEEKLRKIEAELRERGLHAMLVSVCYEHHVTVAEVLRGETTKRVVQARDAFIHQLLELWFSSSEAGNLLGMNHTSVLVARGRHLERIGKSA